MTENEVVALAKALKHLTPSQLDWVRSVLAQFALPYRFWRNPRSDWISPDVLSHLGDALRVHHAISRQALSKDRFEFAFERALILANRKAELAKSRTNRGHDITVDGVRASLKTEAAKGIRETHLHVSKWMELGKGDWKLPALLAHFLGHLTGYERVFSMRCLEQGPKHYQYELVEIPMPLLLSAKDCKLETMKDSKQSPQPGYGRVFDSKGTLLYELYFDGGTERKLQIRSLDKAMCLVHATWEFDSTPL